MALVHSSFSLTGRYDIPAFIADIERVATAESDPHVVAAAVAAQFPRLLATPDLLAPEFRQPDPERYCPHIVAVAPSGAFSVVALVWLPGQKTVIHDHIAWCVVGVLEGSECETRFHLLRDEAGEHWLATGTSETMTHGSVAQLVPPDENIHRVENVGLGLAISLHVYGANLQTVATHSSVNQCFDALAIHDDRPGIAVPWRATYAATPCAD